MADEVLTPQMKREIAARIERCGRCRNKLDLARTLGREDDELRARVDHFEQSQRAALALNDAIKNGVQ